MPRPDDEYDDFDRPPPRPRSRGMGVIPILLIAGIAVLVCGGCLMVVLTLSVTRIRDSANRAKSTNNMREIGLAVGNYNDIHNELPANSYGPDGPLLSWRVHLLPYVEADDLYKQFKLDEPWDSPNNIQLLGRMPRVYLSPNEAIGSTNKTYYRGFSSPGAVFEKGRMRGHAALVEHGLIKPFNLGSFKDPTFETILVIEAGVPVEWSKPDDLDASPEKPFPPIGGMKWRSNRVNVLLGDLTVKAIKSDLPETTFRALVTHSGGETIPAGWDQ